MNDYLSIFNVDNFVNHKNNFINLMKEMPPNKFDDISHTDWNLPKTVKRTYIDYFLKNIFDDYAKHFCNLFKIDNIEMINMWFQIYKKGDFHGLHTHADAHFTNVFFINLPHKNLKTKIYSFYKKELSFEIKEGSIISFPAFYKHESLKNNYEEEKIVIAFNTNVT